MGLSVSPLESHPVPMTPPSILPSQEAIVLIAHGTRHPEDSQVVLRYAQELSEQIARKVYPGFIELLAPSPVEAMRQAIQEGYTQLKIVPYLLFASSHFKKDLRTAIEAIHKEYPQLQVSLCQPLGYDLRMLAILKDRVQEPSTAHF